jgi:hypothetical protein
MVIVGVGVRGIIAPGNEHRLETLQHNVLSISQGNGEQRHS